MNNKDVKMKDVGNYGNKDVKMQIETSEQTVERLYPRALEEFTRRKIQNMRIWSAKV